MLFHKETKPIHLFSSFNVLPIYSFRNIRYTALMCHNIPVDVNVQLVWKWPPRHRVQIGGIAIKSHWTRAQTQIWFGLVGFMAYGGLFNVKFCLCEYKYTWFVIK